MTGPSLASKHRLLPLALWAFFAAASSSARGELATEDLVIDEVADRTFQKGQQIRISGRYLELQDEEVLLFDCPARFLVTSTGIRRKVLEITATSANITLSVRCTEPDARPPRFEILTVEPAPPTSRLLDRDIEAASARGPEHAALMFRLGARILRMAETFEEPEIVQLAKKACIRGLLLKDALRAPGDAAGRVADIREMFGVVPDRSLAMQALAQLETKYPEANEVREFLIELNCRKFRGAWMLYEDFKSQQGFERYGDKWLLPEEKDFLLTIAAYLKKKQEPILRRRLDQEYQLLSSRGEVAVGMRPREVFQALGYPDRVYRKKARDAEFDQWVFGDRYYYFVGDLLIKHPEDDSELASR
ncbi:MAG: hypothetical protein JXA90_02595 [Planctomycetes bacterium]|nr:hypothetical protein [Planctomycetota bacterium]